MMGKVTVEKVTTKQQMHDFIHVVDIIYRDCPQYVPEFESAMYELFKVRTISGLEFSDIQTFVAYRDGEPAGRVVGIINRKANKKWKAKNARFSMIEFIDDMDVSKSPTSTRRVCSWRIST